MSRVDHRFNSASSYLAAEYCCTMQNPIREDAISPNDLSVFVTKSAKEEEKPYIQLICSILSNIENKEVKSSKNIELLTGSKTKSFPPHVREELVKLIRPARDCRTQKRKTVSQTITQEGNESTIWVDATEFLGFNKLKVRLDTRLKAKLLNFLCLSMVCANQ